MPDKLPVLVPAGAQLLLDKLNANGYEAYVVGGCVRDSILGLEPHDWDICTSATPEEVKRCFDGYRVLETGIEHGTVTVFVTRETGYEITTFRIDGEYSDNRRPDSVEFVSSLLEDLSRRDFKMNAMAYSMKSGLIDPFGGITDLAIGIISCVGNPDERFREDALRILRALRFASVYGLTIDAETEKSIHNNAGLLKNISAERINAELCRLLCGENVLYVLLSFSDVFSTIIPQLGPCVGFDQNSRFHQYNVYDHIAHAVANYEGYDVIVKMALLLHDIGKPLCYTEDERGGHFYDHAIPSYALSQDVLSELRFDKKSQKQIAELVRYHDTIIDPAKRSVRKWLNRLGTEQFFRLMDLRIADILAHKEGTQQNRLDKYERVRAAALEILAQNQCFTVKDLAITGKDVMNDGIPQGPLVGAALHVALAAVIAEKVSNEKQALLDLIHQYMGWVRRAIDVPPKETEPFCMFCPCYCDAAYSDSCYSCEEARNGFLGDENSLITN